MIQIHLCDVPYAVTFYAASHVRYPRPRQTGGFIAMR